MTNTRFHRRRRLAFTLLEMVLASALGLMLLAALYLFLETQYVTAQLGREVLEEGVLARSIMTRISHDILTNLGAVDPRVLPDSGSTPTPTTPTDSSSPSSTGSTPTDSTSSESTSANTMASSDSMTAPVIFNLQVSGDTDRVMLSSTRLPAELLTARGIATNSAAGAKSDLRRICYWVVPDRGLARFEVGAATADEASYAPQDIPNPEQYVIAPEVKEISFEYFDGSGWSSSWDGTTPSEDGDTPIGPPSAIAINLKIEIRSQRPGSTEEPTSRTFRHVVAIPAGNNFPRSQ